MAGRIAFQGELGAYSHQACAQARPGFEPVPCTTFEDVVEKTRSGEVDLGMLAVENSTYGRVADVHSLKRIWIIRLNHHRFIIANCGRLLPC